MRGDPSLYQRLNALALDDESASYKFSDRLAKENGWTLAFAKDAIAEYKKFVYLAATSPTPVTPSDIVDQVLHLTYTRSYWSAMCGDILRKSLHHAPTMGGATADARYRTLYAETLAAYRHEFDRDPPQDYWPASGARFESAKHQRWVDTRTHAVIAWRAIARMTAASVAAITPSSAGAAYAAAETKGDPEKLWIGLGALGLLGVVLLLSRLGRHRGRRGSDSGAYYGGDAGGSSGHHHHGGGAGHGHGGDGGGHSGCSGGGDGGGSGCSGGGGCSSS